MKMPAFIRNMLLNAVSRSRATLLGGLDDHENACKDIDIACGYPKEINVQMFKQMYDRNPYAKKVVSVIPRETWAVRPELYDTEDDTETTFEKAWKALDKKHGVLSYLARADKLSGIGSFGVLFIGVDDGQTDLSQPLQGVTDDPNWRAKKVEDANAPPPPPTPTSPPVEGPLRGGFTSNLAPTPPATPPVADKGAATKPTAPKPDAKPAPEAPDYVPTRNIIFMRVLSQDLVHIDKWNSDLTSPRYGQPEMYSLKMLDTNAGATSYVASAPLPSTDLKVHWSRIIHLADNRESSEVFGVERQRAVFNILYDIRKTLGGAAEMFWQGGYPGLGLEVDPTIAQEVELDRDAIANEMAEYYAGLKRYITLQGMKPHSLTPNIADPGPNMTIQIQALAAAIDCPLRVFLGTEEGKLAGGQDSDAWIQRLTGRAMDYVNPHIITPFVERMMMIGVLPVVEEVLIDWPDRNAPSDDEIATTAGKVVKALSDYILGDVATILPPKQLLMNVFKWSEAEAEAAMQDASDYLAENPYMDPAAIAEEEKAAAQQAADQQQQMFDQQSQFGG